MTNAVAERLRQAREHAGYTTVEAVVTAFGWPVYAEHEAGLSPVNPHQATLYAHAFGTEAVWLLSGEGEGPSPAEAIRTRASASDAGDEPELGERIRRLNPEQRAALLAFLRAVQGG